MRRTGRQQVTTEPRKSRVLVVGKGAPERGGIPTFLDSLLTSSLTERYQLSFLNLTPAGRPQGGRPTVTNVARTLRDGLAVWRAAGRHDVVHVHSALAPSITVLRAGLLSLAARSRGCAVIVHAHGGKLDAWLRQRGASAVLRTAMRPASRVVAVWAAGLSRLTEVLDESRVLLIRNGVDVDRFTPGKSARPGPPNLLYVGLLTERKGVLDLLEASDRLRERGLDHNLLLLGGTPDEGSEAAVAVVSAAAGRARLLGTVPPAQMPAVYADADVFCLPSWWEAMPLSILEAMAAGLPVVATEVGEVPGVVTSDVGYVVPARRPDRLADALEPLLRDPDLRRRMGQSARARAEACFSSAAMLDQIAAVYDEVRRDAS